MIEHPDNKALRGINRVKAFYGEEQVAHSYIACPIVGRFDIETGVTAVSGWTTWELEDEKSTFRTR